VADGASIHVAQRGPATGRPVLLLHGITLSAGVWVEQVRRLPDAGMRVVAMDLRGHGESTIGRAGLALDRVTADIVEVVDRLELTDVVLVGHSMGGMAALRLLGRTPSLARGEGWLAALGLVATSARPALGRGVPGARLAVSAIGPALTGAAALARLVPTPTLPDSEVADPIAALTFSAHAAPGAVRLIRRATARVPAATTIELLAELVRLDEMVALAETRVPATVVVGRDDLITPPRHSRALAAAVAGAQLVELADCGHMVMLERPGELDDAILALAARAPAKGTPRRRRQP
ncbi:MAG: alpha/beta fold hydrolase, partial [Acidimicrobiales bacterium]